MSAVAISRDDHEDQLRTSMAYRAGALQSTMYRDLALLECAARILRRQGHHTSLVVDMSHQIEHLKSLLTVVDPEQLTAC